MIQVQGLDLLRGQNTRHMQIEERYLLVVDVGVGDRGYGLLSGKTSISGKRYVRTLIELLDQFSF